MKKSLYYLVVLLIILFSIPKETLAFSKSYDYNYEVKSLTKNTSGDITISGWGIMNAGVCDKSNCYCGKQSCSSGMPASDASPYLRPSYGSGSDSSKCTGNVNNKYLYTLYLVPVNSDGKTYNINAKQKIEQISGGSTSLTSVMCRLSNNQSGVCDAGKSPCYENVGWSFTFNEEIISDEIFKNGYLFYLEIYSTGASVTVGFPLSVYKEKISGFGSNFYYTNGTSISNGMTVKVISFNGYYQTCSNGNCQRFSNQQFANGKKYTVNGVEYDEQTYYKIETSSALYIPSSWVAPSKTESLIIPIKKDVNSCDEETTSQPANSKTINSCSGEAVFSGTNYLGCSVDEFDYYTIECRENNFKAKLSINDSDSTTNKFLLNNGGGFTANAIVDTTLICKYEFNVEKFNDNYENVLYSLNIYDEDDPEYYENYVIKQELDGILQNYINQTTELNEWSSGYDFSSVVATLKVGSKTKNLVVDLLNREKIDLNNDGISENNYCRIEEESNIVLGNETVAINSKVACGEAFHVKYDLPKVCLDMKTGEVCECIPENLGQIDGGRKFYVDLSSRNGDIELSLTNLGYDGNWDVTLVNCSYEIDKLLKERIIFRQIDLNDPFLKQYNAEREIGKNYYNLNYNFVNIIKNNIWDLDFDYQYKMSKTNVNNIKRDTKEEGVSSYLGRSCYFSTNNNYVCNFTRSKNEDGTSQGNWFTDYQIND